MSGSTIGRLLRRKTIWDPVAGSDPQGEAEPFRVEARECREGSLPATTLPDAPIQCPCATMLSDLPLTACAARQRNGWYWEHVSYLPACTPLTHPCRAPSEITQECAELDYWNLRCGFLCPA